jgi:Helix-turn-helix domain
MRSTPIIAPDEPDEPDDDSDEPDEPNAPVHPHEQLRLNKVPQPPPPLPSDWLSTSQAADLLGVPVDTVHGLRRRGSLIGIDSPMGWWFRRDTLLEWLRLQAIALAYVRRHP